MRKRREKVKEQGERRKDKEENNKKKHMKTMTTMEMKKW